MRVIVDCHSTPEELQTQMLPYMAKARTRLSKPGKWFSQQYSIDAARVPSQFYDICFTPLEEPVRKNLCQTAYFAAGVRHKDIIKWDFKSEIDILK